MTIQNATHINWEWFHNQGTDAKATDKVTFVRGKNDAKCAPLRAKYGPNSAAAPASGPAAGR